MRTVGLSFAFAAMLSGCASIDFDSKDKGLTYYEPKPYLFMSVTDKCVSSVSVVSIPSVKKKVKFKSGYGSSELSAEFSNGIITKVGQTSDSKVPETLTSIAALKTAGMLVEGQEPACKPLAILYPIVDGVPDTDAPINFTIGQ
ncbi:hypothetical protein [Ketobacter sp.]|uniref:hypothetical protein n=1 Tax=Ketobacter sp. TaxID=2083498 RepID=UPI0025B7AB42|nr:hypothetical protein [Ketobacter sp.]